jgi:hypothetical protein
MPSRNGLKNGVLREERRLKIQQKRHIKALVLLLIKTNGIL